MKTRKGGVVTKKQGDILEMFANVMKHSTFQYLSNGANGYVFLFTYQGEDSGFVDLKDKRIVKEFIIKLIPFDIKVRWTGKEHYVVPSEEAEFDKEVAIQQHLYKTSLEKFSTALCPAILGNFKILIEHLPDVFPQTFLDGLQFSQGITPVDGFGKTMGIIFMESFTPCESLYRTTMTPMLWTQPSVQEKISKARRLLCMAYECGVSHGDYHLGNILDVTPMMLIDFGRSRMVQPEEQYEFTECMRLAETSHDYSDLIYMLFDDISPGLQNHILYQWLRCPEYPNTPVEGVHVVEVAPPESFPPIEFSSQQDREDCIAGECRTNQSHFLSRLDEVIQSALQKTRKGGKLKRLYKTCK